MIGKRSSCEIRERLGHPCYCQAGGDFCRQYRGACEGLGRDRAAGRLLGTAGDRGTCVQGVGGYAGDGETPLVAASTDGKRFKSA